MALSRILADGIPREHAPGGDPDDAFHAGAAFAYKDAARCMGRAMVYEGDFDNWCRVVGFICESTQNEIRKIYQEAYNGR